MTDDSALQLDHQVSHDLEHDVRKLVDQYREESGASDREIAVVLDAVRAELELGHYQDAYGHDQ